VIDAWSTVVDVVVTRLETADAWLLRDRLGRDLGLIGYVAQGFVVRPLPAAALSAVALRSFATLDDAMAEIATHAKGVCELSAEPSL
jgi:hypothetical protein